MLDKTNIEHRIPEDVVPTAENLIKDLVEAFGGEEKALQKADKASEEARKARETSIKALADKISGINHDLDEETIEVIAQSAAEKIAKGNKQVLKVRKSEIKLLLDSRAQVKTVVDGLEQYRSAVQAKKDPDYNLNLRSATLGALRKMRKNEKTTIQDVVREIEAKRTYQEPDSEKARKLLDKLLDSPCIKGVTAAGREFMDRRAAAAIDVLREVIEKGAVDVTDEELKASEASMGGEQEDVLEEGNLHVEDVLSELEANLSELGAGVPAPEEEASEESEEVPALDVEDLDALIGLDDE
jgi:hypothetical protein